MELRDNCELYEIMYITYQLVDFIATIFNNFMQLYKNFQNKKSDQFPETSQTPLEISLSEPGLCSLHGGLHIEWFVTQYRYVDADQVGLGKQPSHDFEYLNLDLKRSICN